MTRVLSRQCYQKRKYKTCDVTFRTTLVDHRKVSAEILFRSWSEEYLYLFISPVSNICKIPHTYWKVGWYFQRDIDVRDRGWDILLCVTSYIDISVPKRCMTWIPGSLKFMGQRLCFYVVKPSHFGIRQTIRLLHRSRRTEAVKILILIGIRAVKLIVMPPVCAYSQICEAFNAKYGVRPEWKHLTMKKRDTRRYISTITEQLVRNFNETSIKIFSNNFDVRSIDIPENCCCCCCVNCVFSPVKWKLGHIRLAPRRLGVYRYSIIMYTAVFHRM